MLKKVCCYFLEKVDDFFNFDCNLLILKIIAVISGLLIFICSMCTVDSIPATQQDYEPLLHQKEEICEDFKSLFTYDNYSMSASPHSITVTLSNSECKVVCYFDQNLELTDFKKLDNVKPLYVRVMIALFGSILFAYLIYFILSVAIFLILLLLTGIFLLLHLISILFKKIYTLFKRSV